MSEADYFEQFRGDDPEFHFPAYALIWNGSFIDAYYKTKEEALRIGMASLNANLIGSYSIVPVYPDGGSYLLPFFKIPHPHVRIVNDLP